MKLLRDLRNVYEIYREKNISNVNYSDYIMFKWMLMVAIFNNIGITLLKYIHKKISELIAGLCFSIEKMNEVFTSELLY